MAAQPYLKLNLEEKTDQRWEFKGLCVLCLTFGVVALESWQVSINFCSSTRMSFKCSFTCRGGTRQTGGCIKVRHQTGALCGNRMVCVCVCVRPRGTWTWEHIKAKAFLTLLCPFGCWYQLCWPYMQHSTQAQLRHEAGKASKMASAIACCVFFFKNKELWVLKGCV